MSGARILRGLLFCASFASAAACTASAVDVAPPPYQLYFPTGMALSPDERWLFVLSANSDLRYSSGAVQVIDLDRVDAIADAWSRGDAGGAPDCERVPTRPQVLGCPMTLAGGDPAPFVVAGGSVAVGNFGVSLGVQQLTSGGAPSSTVRLFATVRGDPSVTWMDFDGAAGTMSCGGSGDFPRCAETHRLARLRNDADLASMPSEPFTLHVAGEHVFVTHFTTGFVSLISAPSELGGPPPVLQDILSGLWTRSNITGGAGAAGVAARPNDPSGLVYVTSRQEARVALVTVAEGLPDDQGRPTEKLVGAQSFFLSGLQTSGQQGDARDLRFSPDGDRAWIVNRLPPSLHLFDTSLDARGVPRNQLLGSMEVCEQPASLAVADFGGGPIAVVPCFLTGQIFVIDAAALRILTVEQSGRGPNGVIASPKRKKIYVGNYADDTLSVVDATPGSSRQYRTVVRLGKPRPTESR